MAITRFYYGDANRKFQPMNLGGIFCFIVERTSKARYIRLYDINNCKLLFQFELYVNFHLKYMEINDVFHCFPIEKLIIGIEFSQVTDASTFKNIIQQYSIKMEEYEQLKEPKEIKYSISKPISFHKKEYSGWDPVNQIFVLSELPREIKELLKKAGYKKKDLRRKDTALAIYELLVKEIDFNNVTRMDKKIQARTTSNLESLY